MKFKSNLLKPRRPTRAIFVGNIQIGGGVPVSVQSMTNTDTCDVEATSNQIQRLVNAGCEIVRLAIPNDAALEGFKKIREVCIAPLIADIHFNYKLALGALEAGADAVRINPGNLGGAEKTRPVVEACRMLGKSLRLGVNAGSLEADLMERYGGPTPEAMVASARRWVRQFEDWNFDNFKISLKASDVLVTVAAYRQLSKEVDYPLHIGVTEAGGLIAGTVKSALGLGWLLSEGIGDTMRVSLTRDPVEEVRVAYEILRALHIRERGVEIISCPTCGRCQIDLFSLAEEAERRLAPLTKPIKVAIMGCVVNGPGEAREADVGIAGGKGVGALIKKGEMVRTVPEGELLRTLLLEVAELTGEAVDMEGLV
ncbi:flavodoxin-dependent (E)-4-hydroxy-3-methylbut-2-enyl-diphosphate synthase [Desulfobacca acetoxidans]|uniref:4-hydroxy-3-methylbut-2-en-1-yl diphosphate synthase (flavodoxin) n=1 Tax=Desulfobacca acetoxidans (strain ATCC 700848 / DSM 11109 / ASRB2) TaxID=880072 RepID=F2NJE9_DESAR|nr:flavodoxin-dependent (E)-4-hydroxy-3-methylbut-2-enyl-diphosphate synthase [Desulfobacca acetoxidans]AEB09461.1 4-hydroxy-3-methylbut-2-en-1-yl diphosphate synthase [Desulfobacca acetoxidans DSM 11109]